MRHRVEHAEIGDREQAMRSFVLGLKRIGRIA